MKRWKQWTGGLGAAGLLGLASVAGGTERPDVVFVLVDDLRWDAFSFMGHEFVETPRMDQLRASGAWLENAFVTTSICCPSRATFLTGTYASRHGVIDNQGAEYVPAVTPSFTEQLQETGYRTAMIGKWHMGIGHGDDPRPGFDYWLSFEGQGVYHDPLVNINGEHVQLTGYTTDLLTDYAIEFIEAQPLDQPYFVMLSHKAVHEPFEPADRHRNLWGADREIREPVSFDDTFEGKAVWQRREHVMDRRWDRRDRDSERMEVPCSIPEETFSRRKWFVEQLRCLASVDEGVGRVMDMLEKRGTLGRTIFVLAGDNGYFHGEHRRWDKRVPYDEAMRIPIIISYPDEIRTGSTVSELVTNVDFAPTILDFAGLAKTPVMQGRSMRPLLKGEGTDWPDAVFYEYWVDLTHTIPATVAVRTDRYKFIRYPGIDDLDELYDLKNDPFELENLIGRRTYAGVRTKMVKRLEQLMEETGWRPDVRPLNLPEYRGPRGLLLDLKAKQDKALNSAGPVTVEASEALNFGRGPIIIEAGVRATGDGVILAQSAPETGFKLFVENGKPGVSIYRETWIGSHSTIDAREGILDGPTKLRVVLDWNQLRLEVDGELAAEMALPMPYDSTELAPLVIGGNSPREVYERTPSNDFSGTIESLKIWRELDR